MTDIVFIQGLRIDGLIGVYAHERTARRPLVFDIEMRFDTRAAAASDQLSGIVRTCPAGTVTYSA